MESFQKPGSLVKPFKKLPEANNPKNKDLL
jgi:hypothetical protein